jgi:predicted protein tyrosine phosphatase
MLTNINFISRYQAEKQIFNKDDIVISINEEDGIAANIKGTENVLRLFFMDIDDSLLDTKYGKWIFNESQAKEILEFVEKYHNHSTEYQLTVHCHAGVSRSAAIALFAHYHTKATFPTISQANLANKYVVGTLSKFTKEKIIIPEIPKDKKTPGGIILF